MHSDGRSQTVANRPLPASPDRTSSATWDRLHQDSAQGGKRSAQAARPETLGIEARRGGDRAAV